MSVGFGFHTLSIKMPHHSRKLCIYKWYHWDANAAVRNSCASNCGAVPKSAECTPGKKMQGAARANANRTVGCGICVYRYAAAVSSNAKEQSVMVDDVVMWIGRREHCGGVSTERKCFFPPGNRLFPSGGVECNVGVFALLRDCRSLIFQCWKTMVPHPITRFFLPSQHLLPGIISTLGTTPSNVT